jgi:hypothetical protein
LQEVLRPILLRRMKEDVETLPEKEEVSWAARIAGCLSLTHRGWLCFLSMDAVARCQCPCGQQVMTCLPDILI